MATCIIEGYLFCGFSDFSRGLKKIRGTFFFEIESALEHKMLPIVANSQLSLNFIGYFSFVS